jgi:nitrogen fixation protein NifX
MANSRVAFATSDGKVINVHFGRANQFVVLLLEGQNYKFVELRKVNPLCSEFNHDDNDLERTVGIFSDCEAVFAERIGQGAAKALFAKGIKPYEATCLIEDAIKEYISYE